MQSWNKNKMPKDVNYQTYGDMFSQDFSKIILSKVTICQEEFHHQLFDVKVTTLFDLLLRFQSACKNCAKHRAKLRNISAQLKRKKELLWNSVGKTVSAVGMCLDKRKVYFNGSYTIKEVNEEILEEIKALLEEVENSLISELTYEIYNENDMVLKIEQLLYDLVYDVKLPTICTLTDKVAPSLSSFSDLILLKQNISVLFSFQREPTNDKDFLLTTQKWLTKLVSILLQNGTLDDYLFLVNHVLRCPYGISAWACEFIHLPSPQKEKGYKCEYLHHMLVVLILILNPVYDRELFLKNIKHAKVPFDTQENYIILDCDIDEGNIFEQTSEWSENDILSLLHRLPFLKLIKHVSFLSSNSYDVQKATDENLFKLIGFSTNLINILLGSLQNFVHPNFVQLMNEIYSLARYTIQCVYDHCKFYKDLNESFNSALQMEFDKFIFHIVYVLFSIKELVVWKFLSCLPYSHVSAEILWTIVWIFHSPGSPEETLYSEIDIVEKLRDETVQDIFLEKLSTLDQSEVVYVFKTYQNMTMMRYEERDFTYFVSQEIFEAVFRQEVQKVKYSTEGIFILLSIAQNNLYLISHFLKLIDSKGEEVAARVQYLFTEIDLTSWVPYYEDMQILTKWLLSEILSSRNILASIILTKMNWNHDNEGKLYLPLELHNEVAILVLSALMKYEKGGNKWLTSKSMLQMFDHLPNASYPTDKNFDFRIWAWELIFSLKLHVMDESHPPLVQIYDGYEPNHAAIDMYQSPFLNPLSQAFDMNHPMGLYLALAMTKLGHSIKCLDDVGLLCISKLVESHYYIAATNLLFYTLPFYAKNPELFLANPHFKSCIYNIIIADQTWFSFISDSNNNRILDIFATMMKKQIEKTSEISIECANPILKLWLHLLMHLLSFQDVKHKSRGFFLLNVLVQIAFKDQHTRDYFLDQMNFISSPFDLVKGKHSSWWDFFTLGHNSFSSIRLTLPEHPWAAFYVFLLETRHFYKEIWISVLKQMIKNESLKAYDALKEASQLLDINTPPLTILPIYQWAFQIVNTPVSHPSVVLLWQQFFICYFQRVSNRSCNSFEKYSKSIGPNFFQGKPYSKLFERLKLMLKNVQDYYAKCCNISKQLMRSLSMLDRAKENERLQIFKLLRYTFRTFSVWIVKRELHNPSLYLSTLHTEYNVEKLKLIIENDQRLWFELVLGDSMQLKLNCSNVKESPVVKNEIKLFTNTANDDSESLLLHSYKSSKVLQCPNLICHAEEMNSFHCLKGMPEIVENNHRIVRDKEMEFTKLLTRLKKLNSKYTTWITQEYRTNSLKAKRKKKCSKGFGIFSTLHYKCSGSATVQINIQVSKIDRETLIKLKHNREEYDCLLEKLINFPLKEICLISINMEKYVSCLMKQIKSSKQNNAGTLISNGERLFYLQMRAIDKSNKLAINYSPLQYIWSSSFDVLGKEFIEGKSEHCSRLATAIIKYPSAGKLVTPLFKPNTASPMFFLEMYEILTQNVKKCSPSTMIVLLSKIDLSNWLNDKKVTYLSRKRIFKALSQAFYLCKTPDEYLLPVYEVFKKHFCILLLYMFPDHYSDTLHLLLEDIGSNNLYEDIWYTTLQCLGCYDLNKNSSCNDIKIILKNVPNVEFLHCLNILQIGDILDIFDKYIMNIRRSSNLYTECKKYNKPIAIFIAMMCHLLIDFSIERNTSQIYNVQDLFGIILKAFSPYIFPASSYPKFPWTQNNENDAVFVFQMFTTSLEYLHEKLLRKKLDQSLLLYIWRYYYDTYILHDLFNRTVLICHIIFSTLPWHDFYPSFEDIEKMHLVLQRITSTETLMEVHIVTNIIAKVPWCDVITYICQTSSPQYSRNVLAVFGKLLIFLSWKSSLVTNLHQNNLETLQDLPWHNLTITEVEELLNLYYNFSDQLKLLAQQPKEVPEVCLFQFLKKICCIMPKDNMQPLSNKKMLLFTIKFIKSVSYTISEKKKLIDKETEDIFCIVPNFLSDIELEVLKDVPPDQQITFCLPLIQEVFRFFCLIGDHQQKHLFLEHTVVFLKDRKRSVLLLPCLKAACISLNSIDDLVTIVECCIDTRFSTCHDASESHYIWQLISSFYKIPLVLNNDYLEVCAEKSSHLSFYLYIMHRMPQTLTIDGKAELLYNIIDYIKKTKLDKISESKIILLWDKLLELFISLISENELQVVCRALSVFCSILSSFGEYRTKKGFFSFIGLGCISPLSTNFRFLCCAMSAFLYAQMSQKGTLKFTSTMSGYMLSTDYNNIQEKSTEAIKALEVVKSFYDNYPCLILQNQIDYAVKSILNPNVSLLESRQYLKKLAGNLFRQKTYLNSLEK